MYIISHLSELVAEPRTDIVVYQRLLTDESFTFSDTLASKRLQNLLLNAVMEIATDAFELKTLLSNMGDDVINSVAPMGVVLFRLRADWHARQLAAIFNSIHKLEEVEYKYILTFINDVYVPSLERNISTIVEHSSLSDLKILADTLLSLLLDDSIATKIIGTETYDIGYLINFYKNICLLLMKLRQLDDSIDDILYQGQLVSLGKAGIVLAMSKQNPAIARGFLQQFLRQEDLSAWLAEVRRGDIIAKIMDKITGYLVRTEDSLYDTDDIMPSFCRLLTSCMNAAIFDYEYLSGLYDMDSVIANMVYLAVDRQRAIEIMLDYFEQNGFLDKDRKELALNIMANGLSAFLKRRLPLAKEILQPSLLQKYQNNELLQQSVLKFAIEMHDKPDKLAQFDDLLLLVDIISRSMSYNDGMNSSLAIGSLYQLFGIVPVGTALEIVQRLAKQVLCQAQENNDNQNYRLQRESLLHDMVVYAFYNIHDSYSEEVALLALRIMVAILQERALYTDSLKRSIVFDIKTMQLTRKISTRTIEMACDILGE